jgi:FixJ family two-component response regulator
LFSCFPKTLYGSKGADVPTNPTQNFTPDEPTHPTVFIVDDDYDTRDSLKLFVESIGFHVADFDCVHDFLEAHHHDMPGCLIMDVRLPKISGLELQDHFQRKNIHLPIIFLTNNSNVSIAVRTMKAGAVDFLEKPFDEQLLLDSIHKAMGIDRKIRETKQQHSRIMEKIGNLSQREEEVLRLLIQGKANKVIASNLGLSTKTIETHRAHIMRKLGVSSMAGLMWMAITSGEYHEVPEQLPFTPLDPAQQPITLS